MRILLAAILGLTACSSFKSDLEEPMTDAATPAPSSQIIQIEAFSSDFVASRGLSIYLPPGYDDSAQNYPVIYAMDGQNLFEPGLSYIGEEWGLDEAMDRLIASGSIRPAIIVGVWNTPLRAPEYGPQGVIEILAEPQRNTIHENWQSELLGDAYLSFLSEELKPYIDTRYRTRPGPEDTMIMGSSMGGLISFYALAERPDIFGTAAGLSTHWPVFADDSFSDPDRANDWRAALLPAWQNYIVQSDLDPDQQRIWLDHGTINLDALYPPYQIAIDAMMDEKGFTPGARFQSREYAGADHNEIAWRERLDDPLMFLLGWHND